jgi:RNA polymerase sigma factor (sigma-70 family)
MSESPPDTAASTASGSEVFAQHIDLIDAVTAFIRKRHHLGHDEGDEFSSHVRLKLLENDAAVLRRFCGRSTLRTYLVTVIHRLFLDFRIERWGKWRPSAQARRLGPVAMRLEMLLSREGMPLDQAVEVLRLHYGVTASNEELERLRAALPPRIRQRSVEESAAADHSAAEGGDDLLRDREQQELAQRTEAALERALARLEPDDRLVLKMRFEDGFAIADIARARALDQKKLYRRLETLLARLRESLEADGIRSADAAQLIGSRQVDLRFRLIDKPAETARLGPSQ